MQIETRLDAKLGSMMVKWIVGAISGLGIAGITVMTFMLDNAALKAPPAAPAPIVIAVPPAPAASGTTALPLK